MNTIQALGAYPAAGSESREKKLFYKLSDASSLKMISGTQTPALLSVWASNDVVQFGTIRLLAGGTGPQQTEYDEHPGDAVFYVRTGPMTFYLRDRKETFLVEEGDFMFIPEHEAYKIINYGGKPVDAVFVIAPEF